MALIKNIVLKDNFNDDKQFVNAYIKIDSLSGNIKVMNITINTYREKDGQQINCQQLVFVPDLNGKNFFAQAYDYLKTLPEFAGATDC